MGKKKRRGGKIFFVILSLVLIFLSNLFFISMLAQDSRCQGRKSGVNFGFDRLCKNKLTYNILNVPSLFLSILGIEWGTCDDYGCISHFGIVIILSSIIGLFLSIIISRRIG